MKQKLFFATVVSLTFSLAVLVGPKTTTPYNITSLFEFGIPTAFADPGGEGDGGDGDSGGGERESNVNNVSKSPTLRRLPRNRTSRENTTPPALRPNVYALARVVARTKRELDNARARMRGLGIVFQQYAEIKGPAAGVTISAVLILAVDKLEQEIKDLEQELRWAVEEMAKHGR